MTDHAFVTVAHAEDGWLLRLQARSMRLHLPADLAGEIVVVENFDPGRSVAWRDALLAEYGGLAGRVRFVSRGAFGPLPAGPGWWTQQALKLLACGSVGSGRAVVLDAKNHLLRPWRRALLEAPDGRMRARRYDYRRHPLRHFLERTLRYCALPLEPHLGWFMQACTPFAIDAADARDAIAFVEAGAGGSFAARLVEARITEFFLLAARLERRGLLDARYEFSQPACPVVWDDMADPAALEAVVREADATGAAAFAVHRRTIPRLDGASREILGRFWARHGLFGSAAEAVGELGSAAAMAGANGGAG